MKEAQDFRSRYNPDGSTLRKAQLRMLEMLKFIDKVCSENSLTYWLDSGTLLGAMRHGGFIPWDDDTDICMPYEDMMKFKRIMLENNPSKQYVLQCHETDPNYYNFYIVLKDLDSEIFPDPQIDRRHYTYRHRGLYVDIFPLERNIVSSLYTRCNKLYLSYIFKPIMYDKKKYVKRRAHIARSYRLFKSVYIPFLRAISKLCGKRSYYMMSYGCPFISKRYVANIYPLKRAAFEDASLVVPGNSDKYLQEMYGDWRAIPDEEHRATHFLTRVDFKNHK